MHRVSATIRAVALTELGPEDLKRRIHAARLLRGISQEELDRLFAEDGLGKSAGRLERGDPRITLNRALLTGLIRHLRVPEEWFTVRDVDSLVFPDGAPESTPKRLSVIEEQLRLAREEAEARATQTEGRVLAVIQLLDERLPPNGEARSRRLA